MNKFLIAFLVAEALTASVRFEANRGQTDVGVQFIARTKGQHVFLSNSDVVFESGVRMSFVGAAGSWLTGPATESISYFVGNDPSRWVREAPVFERVTRRAIYPGIDAVFYGNAGRLEYDLVLSPGADPSRILVRFKGRSRLLKDGSIEAGAIRQRAPVIYQMDSEGRRQPVSGRFLRTAAGEYRLALGAYERSRKLVIDPVIEMSTYLGGENDDEVIVVEEGYIAGNTRSVAFPGTTPARRRSRDIFVRGTGPALVNSVPRPAAGRTVILGGSDDDELAGLVGASNSEQIYLAGTTRSRDFPVTNGSAYRGGVSDGFVTNFSFGRFNSLPVAEYIGGSGEDRIHALAQSGSVIAYAGVTDSPDLPVTNESRLSGGRDAFYGVTIEVTRVRNVGYLGGSGDDAAYAVAVADGRAYIGGEFRSSDFLPGLQGESDAFLAVANTLTLLETRRIGGSGTDRIQAITARQSGTATDALVRTVFNPFVAITGTTTSPDLPVRNAAQPALAGESDAFAGVWDPTAGDFSWLTYFGTPGVDEATSVAQNWAGDIIVGGWSRRESEDGSVAVFDMSGRLFESTFLGGSGDDRVLGVGVAGRIARAAGFTKSADFPQVSPWQTERGGGIEGFVADIGGTYLSGASEVIMAKDSRLTLSLRAPSSALRQPVTYQSSDPAKVRIVRAQAAAEDNLELEALSDSGEVEITATSPGLETKRIRVRLYPGAFVTSSPSRTVSTFADAFVSVRYAAIDRERNQALGGLLELREGVSQPAFTWQVSDPAVLQIETPNAPFTRLQPRAPGQVRMTVSAPGIDVFEPEPLIITVQSPAAVNADLRLGKDLIVRLPNINGLLSINSPHPVVAVSEDPSKLLLSTSQEDRGQPSVTTTLGCAIFAHALSAEGTVRVLLSSPAIEGTSIQTITLEPTVLHWGRRVFLNPPASEIRPEIAVVGTTSIDVDFRGVSGSTSVGLRPGAGVTARLTNSAPEAIEVSRMAARLDSREGFVLTPRSPGTAELGLTLNTSDIRLSTPTIRATYNPSASATLTVPASVEVGKDLQQETTIQASGGGDVVITTSDPSAVVLAPGALADSVPVLRIQRQGGPVNFMVRALKSDCSTKLRVQAEGLERSIPIQCLASGLALTRTSNLNANVQTAPLDEVTGYALSQQPLRPGVSADIRLEADSPNAEVTPASFTLTTSSPARLIAFRVPAANAAYTLRASAAGFAPATLKIDRDSAPPSFSNLPSVFLVPKGGLTTFSFFDSSAPEGVTFTSEDPSKLLISSTPTEPPQPAITVPQGRSAQVTLHGLAEIGSTALLVSRGGSPLRIPVGFTPFRASVANMQVAPGISAFVQLQTVTQAPTAPPMRFRVRVLDPSIATLDGDIVEIRQGTTTISPKLTGVAPGRTTLQIVEGPEGVELVSTPNNVTVAPSSNSQQRTFVLGKYLEASLALTTASRNESGAIATVTSSDPSKVQLVRTPGAEPSGSITVALPAGSQTTQQFLIRALASEGEVTLTLSGPTIEPSTATIRLQPSWFALGSSSARQTVATGYVERAELRLLTLAVPDPVLTTFPNATPIGNLPPTAIRVTSDNPAVVSVTPEVVQFDPQRGGAVVIEAKSVGDATITIEQPEGFGPALFPTAVTRLVRVPSLYVSCPAPVVATPAAPLQCSVGAPSYTATAVDPSKIRVNAGPGGLQVTAIATSGTYEVVLNAFGFEEYRFWVVVRP